MKRKTKRPYRQRIVCIEQLEVRNLFSGLAPHVLDVALQSSQTDFVYQMPTGAQQLMPIPWAGLDQVRIRFSENVSAGLDHLLVSGIQQPQIGITGFAYDSLSHTATWTLDAPLTSDKWMIRVLNEITDDEKLPLDGEWWNGNSIASGDRIAGGEFEYHFDILIGDVDQNSESSVGDFGMVLSHLNGVPLDARWDVNTDGWVDSDDLAAIDSSYGNLKGLADQGSSLSVAVVGDLNGDGTNEFVVLDSGNASSLSLHDPATGIELATANLASAFRFIDIEPIFSGNSSAQSVAVLGVHRQSGGARAWIWDLHSSVPTTSIAFNRPGVAEDMEVIFEPLANSTRIAVLARIPDLDRTRVHIADLHAAATNQIIEFGKGFSGFDLEIMEGTLSEPPVLAVAGLVPASGGVRIKTSSMTGVQRGTFSYGKVVPVDFEVYRNEIGEQRYALLREQNSNGIVRVDVRDATGMKKELIEFTTNGAPADLEVDQVNSIPRLAILTDHPKHHENIVYVTENSGLVAEAISFGSGFTAQDFAIASVGGDTGLIVAQQSGLLNAQQVKTRNASKQTRLHTVPIGTSEGIPRWFESNRVQGHTRLSMVDPRLGLDRSYFETEESNLAAAAFVELGAHAFTRHAVTMNEDPWWPSELPADENGVSLFDQARDNFGISLDARENLVQGFVNSAWDENLPMMGYYFDISDATMQDLHPEWVCTDSAGEIVSHVNKGDFLDITGPYGDVVQQRLLELADMGLSGVYLDFRHIPAGGCWSSQMALDFEAETGFAPPPISNTSEYRQFAEFSARRMQEVIGGWEQRLRREFPHFQVVVSVTSVPALTRLDMGVGLASIGNPKSEFAIAINPGQSNNVFRKNTDLYEPPHDVRMALGWTLLREVAESGLPHVWNAFTPNRDHLFAFLSAVTSYGGIAALDVVEELLLPGGQVDGFSSRQDLADGFALVNRGSPHLSGTEPVQWAAVLFSENSRNMRGIDSRAIWEEVNSPTVGAFQAVQRSQRPVSVLTDLQLVEGKALQYQVLMLPNPGELSPEQILAVQQFVNAGGTVIENDTQWDWSSEAGYNAALSELELLLDAAITSAPVRVDGLPDGVHSVSYHKVIPGVDAEQIVIAIANQFEFSQSSTIFDPIPPIEVNPTPPNVPAGAVLRLDNALNAAYLTMEAAELLAIDAISGEVLPIVKTAEGFEITLPEIERMLLIVVEPISASYSEAIPYKLGMSEQTSEPISGKTRFDVNQVNLLTPFVALSVFNANQQNNFLAGESASDRQDIFQFDVNQNRKRIEIEEMTINHLDLQSSAEKATLRSPIFDERSDSVGLDELDESLIELLACDFTLRKELDIEI